MYRTYVSDQKQKLVDLIAARTGTPRSELLGKSVAELEAILDDSLMAQIRAEAAQAAETADDELIRSQAEREVDRVLHQLRMDKARQPQREVEDKRLLTVDRKTFLEACRQYRIGSTDANFSLIRTTLGPGFTTYQIGQRLRSGTLHVSPATPEEIQGWTQEAQEQRQQFLRNADPVTLRSIVRSEAEQKRQQVAQAQLDATQASAKRRHDLRGYVSLTPESRHRGNVIDARYIKTVDAQALRELVKIYGDFQLNNILRYGNAQGA